MAETLLEVKHLSKVYKDKYGQQVRAVNDVSFEIRKGEILAFMGPSGCGKSTLAKTILKLSHPTSGEVIFQGHNIFSLKEKQLRKLRPQMQIIFQNSAMLLNPRMKVIDIIKEGMIANHVVPIREQNAFLEELLKDCQIDKDLLSRNPDKLSGGERQRVSIARALALRPQFIIADEITSALDKEVSKQILDLIRKLRKEKQITLLFISHDASSVRYVADRIATMEDGKIVNIVKNNKEFI